MFGVLLMPKTKMNVNSTLTGPILLKMLAASPHEVTNGSSFWGRREILHGRLQCSICNCQQHYCDTNPTFKMMTHCGSFRKGRPMDSKPASASRYENVSADIGANGTSCAPYIMFSVVDRGSDGVWSHIQRLMRSGDHLFTLEPTWCCIFSSCIQCYQIKL